MKIWTMCQYCYTDNLAMADYCRNGNCQYPLRWSDGIAVNAPQSLIDLARDWHGGQSSGLYSVLSTGSIWKTRAHQIESELRADIRQIESLNLSKKSQEKLDLEKMRFHLKAIEQLTAQLPEDSE